MFKSLSNAFEKASAQDGLNYEMAVSAFARLAKKMSIGIGKLSEEFGDLAWNFRGLRSSITGFEDRLDEFNLRGVRKQDGSIEMQIDSGITDCFMLVHDKFMLQELIVKWEKDGTFPRKPHVPKP